MTAAPRVLLYCHNVFGLGHIIRSLRIGTACIDEQGMECAIITGCRALDQLDVRSDVLIERLPVVRAHPGDQYSIRPEDATILIDRSRRIVRFVAEWQPDVVLVDGNPIGLGGEITYLLLSGRGQSRTRFVWGIPYAEAILVTGRESPMVRNAIAQFESAIAYTDPAWQPLLDEIESLPPRTGYTGFVAQPPPPVAGSDNGPIVCLVGGGSFGSGLFAHLRKVLDAFPGRKMRFVVGPLGSSSDAHAVCENDPRIELLETATVDEALRDASIVVSRVGYNTAFAVVQTELPVIFVPIPVGSSDQRDRAERFRQIEGVWIVDETAPTAVADLRSAIAAALARGRKPRALPFHLDGASNAATWLAEVARRTNETA